MRGCCRVAVPTATTAQSEGSGTPGTESIQGWNACVCVCVCVCGGGGEMSTGTD